MVKSIGIVGAGAKAAALVARAAVLRDQLGEDRVPQIHVFERAEIGSAWSGTGNFSSGFLTLCTPGEKDVGFPYHEIMDRGGVRDPIGPMLFANFSWQSYLVANGLYSDWVDRGRGHPEHRDWSAYLRWVFDTAGQPITKGEVTDIFRRRGKWEVMYRRGRSASRTLVDGIVLTGVGRPRSIPCRGDPPPGRVLDSETFWPARNGILQLQSGSVAVAGDGGAAGAIVAWLAEKLAEREVTIDSINPVGTLFPRGDGYAERRWFSDPSDWPELSLEHRRKLLSYTEAGVVSGRLKHVIDQSRWVHYHRGRAVSAQWNGSTIEIDVEYEGLQTASLEADYLVVATGFDSWSRLSLIRHPAAAALRAPRSNRKRISAELRMTPELSLPKSSGMPGGVHVPGLCGLRHGPGMGNLGCLGLMAEAILRPYL